MKTWFVYNTSKCGSNVHTVYKKKLETVTIEIRPCSHSFGHVRQLTFSLGIESEKGSWAVITTWNLRFQIWNLNELFGT